MQTAEAGFFQFSSFLVMVNISIILLKQHSMLRLESFANNTINIFFGLE